MVLADDRLIRRVAGGGIRHRRVRVWSLARRRLSSSGAQPDQVLQRRLVRKLPEVRDLIERTEIVRDWLEAAARCECPSLDECPLFDDPALLPQKVPDSRPPPGRGNARRCACRSGPGG